MKVFLAALVVVALCVFGMCFNIIFRKDGHFPDYEVSSNKDMRRLGIRCMKEEDDIIHGDRSKPRHEHCDGEFTEACKGCALFVKEAEQ